MTAKILAFPKGAASRPSTHRSDTLARTWSEQHVPLIDAATDLFKSDDAEFARRCGNIAAEEGPSVLAQLASQLDRLATHLADVVATLAATARRIRAVTLSGAITS